MKLSSFPNNSVIWGQKIYANDLDIFAKFIDIL